jgi:hypothetical protein
MKGGEGQLVTAGESKISILEEKQLQREMGVGTSSLISTPKLGSNLCCGLDVNVLVSCD